MDNKKFREVFNALLVRSRSHTSLLASPNSILLTGGKTLDGCTHLGRRRRREFTSTRYMLGTIVKKHKIEKSPGLLCECTARDTERISANKHTT